MSHPEISKRCLECGATVRADARFCPQCGKLMKKDSSPLPSLLPPPPPDNGAAQNPSSTARDVNTTATAAAGVVAAEAGGATTAGANPGAKPLATEARQEPLAVAASRRRPAEMVRDNLRPRVEKLRDASMTVFEEASDDTGLRFVLIAVALFLLFLLFLFLNNIIR